MGWTSCFPEIIETSTAHYNTSTAIENDCSNQILQMLSKQFKEPTLYTGGTKDMND